MGEKKQVGYIGLGNIGKPSALRLLDGPFEVLNNQAIAYAEGPNVAAVDGIDAEDLVIVADISLLGNGVAAVLARHSGVDDHSTYFGGIRRCNAQ